jgi:histidine triad (HIT) family protein
VSRTLDDACVFCRIIMGLAQAEVVREWATGLALVPLKPVTEGHLLVIPREHVPDVSTSGLVTASSAANVSQLIRERSMGDVNVITSRGTTATQSVFHLHWHVIPRRVDDGLALPWYSGRGGKWRGEHGEA